LEVLNQDLTDFFPWGLIPGESGVGFCCYARTVNLGATSYSRLNSGVASVPPSSVPIKVADFGTSSNTKKSVFTCQRMDRFFSMRLQTAHNRSRDLARPKNFFYAFI
jgi:hypothetical protein